MNHDNVPIRQAATVMMLRDSDAGVQTYMLRRNRRTVFGPGMHVFPGGALDEQDNHPDLLARCDGLDDVTASTVLGVEQGGMGLWVAALRECFEEAGVLIATDTRGAQPPVTEALTRAREQLNAGATGLLDICRDFDLRLPLSRLCYYSHWVTPRGAPRRFSTRFFACGVEAGQKAAYDGSETVAGEWVTPAVAVERFEQGDFPMMPPTIVQLRFLCAYTDVASTMAVLRGIAPSATLEAEGRRSNEHGHSRQAPLHAQVAGKP